MSNQKHTPQEITEALEILASTSQWRVIMEYCELRMDQTMESLCADPDYAMIRFYQGQIAAFKELYNVRSAEE